MLVRIGWHVVRRATVIALIVSVSVRAGTASAAPCWQPPVAGAQVVDPFREPPCPYCAGNRGQEHRSRPGAVVRAVSAGLVTWAGVIDATRYVVVRHPDGLRTTYGMLDTAAVSAGDRVLTGTAVGTTTQRFYFGVRRGDQYVDPAPMIGVVIGRPRLVPVDGSPARPGAPSLLRCRADIV